jgi:hypothetical protein
MSKVLRPDFTGAGAVYDDHKRNVEKSLLLELVEWAGHTDDGLTLVRDVREFWKERTGEALS